jgi:hypothetical protein
MIDKKTRQYYEGKNMTSAFSGFVNALKKWIGVFLKTPQSAEEINKQIDEEEEKEDLEKDLSHIESLAPDQDVAIEINDIFGFDVDDFLSMGVEKIKEDTADIYKRMHATPFEEAMNFQRSAAKYGIKYEADDLAKIYELHKNIGNKQAEYDEILTGQVGITGDIGKAVKKTTRNVVSELNKPLTYFFGMGATSGFMDALRKDIEKASDEERNKNKNAYGLQRQGD